MRAVSNAGPLIHLSWIQRLDVLQQLFAEVVVPAEVETEVLRAGDAVLGVQQLRAAFAAGVINVAQIFDREGLLERMKVLDVGEAATLELMRQQRADIVLLDDRRARLEAERLGFALTGTVGLLRQARERGLIPNVLPLLIELRARGFWSSEALLERIRREESGSDA